MKTSKFRVNQIRNGNLTTAFRNFMFQARIASNPDIRRLEMTIRSMNLQRQP
jgi:hypothetical protein